MNSFGILLFLAGLAVFVYFLVAYVMSLVGGEEVSKSVAHPFIKLGHFFGRLLQSVFSGWMERRREKDLLFLEQSGLADLLEPIDLPGSVLAAAVTVSFLSIFTYGFDLRRNLAGLALGAFLGVMWFRTRRQERQDEIVREFPTAVDVICVAISGGLDFSQAMKEVADNMGSGPVVQEFKRILREVGMGSSRTEALRRFASRVLAIEVRAFVTSLVQTIEIGGSGLRESLQTQAAQLRYNRLIRAETAANKIPTKMLLPLVVFILPCLLIVVFVPLIIQVIATWKGM